MARPAMLTVLSIGICLAIFGTCETALAADASGTWTWKIARGDQEFELTMDLKQDGEKLTGSLALPTGDSIDIKEGSLKNDELSFNVEFDRNGNVRVMKYKGKLDGDTIKGTREMERNGEAVTRDWEAKRVKK
jgi:hypothetical protein